MPASSTSAWVVCRSRPAIAALPHVCGLVASMLAPPRSWTIARAIQRGHLWLADILIGTLASDSTGLELERRAQARKAVHAAAFIGDVQLMQRLVETFGCVVDETAATEAGRGGHLQALQWVYDKLQRGQRGIVVRAEMLFSSSVVFPIVAAGNLEMLQWICDVLGGDTSIVSLHEAAMRGHLHVVEWLCEQSPSASLSPRQLYDTAEAGQLEILQFLHARQPITSSLGMTGAVLQGHLDLVRWLHSVTGEAYSSYCIGSAIDHAASAGNLDAVRWVHEHLQPNQACSTQAMDAAARNGHLEVVKFLHENRSEGCTVAAMNGAATKNHMEVVQYLAMNGKGCSTNAMDGAAAQGHLDMVKWLHYGGVPCTDTAMNCAAANGHLNVVQFLHANRSEGCTVFAMDGAALAGHLTVIQWLHANREEGCTTSAMDGAAANGHLDVVQWLHTHRTEGCTVRAMDTAAARGHLEVVKFLHANRTEGCTTAAIDSAALGGHFDIIKWLHQHRSEGCTTSAFDWAASRDHMEIVLWLGEHLFKGWTSAARSAAEHGSILLLEWLHAHGDLSDGIEIAGVIAAEHGNVEMLQWFYSQFPDAMRSAADRLRASALKVQRWFVFEWLGQM